MSDIEHVPVCTACGTPLPDLAAKHERLEAEATSLHRKCSHLKAELTKLLGRSDLAKDIAELHDAWLAPRSGRGGKKPALTEDRQKAYARLLRDYGKEEGLKAVRQSAKTPYLVFGRYQAKSDDPRDRRDDITEIVAKAARVEQLIAEYDGTHDPVPELSAPAENHVPPAHRLHNVNDGWTPLNRAVQALKREGGWDTATAEYEEATLLSEWPRLVRWHSWCPCHPHTFVGLRLWEGDDRRVHAECDGACSEATILQTVFGLEDRQVERAQALLAFERVANPQTLDKLVRALSIREGESRYSLARKLGIHDNEALGLNADPLELKWAA